MHAIDILRDLAVIFAVSILVVLILHRLRLPTFTGFLICGALVGPHGLSLVSDIEHIEVLAEVGVILLLFTVGMEFSLATVRRLWGTAFLGAFLPITICAGLGAAGARLAGAPAGQGIFLGFLVGLSSTVIPLKSLADRGQIDSPHGRAATGVAVFQDLLVIPMMLLVPSLAGDDLTLLAPLRALGGPAVAIAIVMVVALWAGPRLLARLAALESRDIFIISIFLICLGTAWVTSALGLSLALGAFIAGLVVSESEYCHQALAEVLPLRDSLNSLFFVSVGMLIDPMVFVRSPITVMAAALAILVIKPILIGGVLIISGRGPTVALQAGLTLAQVGEFSFVLMRFGAPEGLLPGESGQIFLAASVVTMTATPLVLAVSSRLVASARRWEGSGRWQTGSDLRPDADDRLGELAGHVVIVGYGFNGRNLALVLKEIGIPYVVLEMNSRTVREARMDGEMIVYGDVASPVVLDHLGAGRAKVLVIAISDPVSTRRAVSVAKRGFPALHIIVRTRYLSEVDDLYRVGADVVIPEEVETSMEIFSRVLECFGVPRESLVKHARRIRTERYGLFRSGRLESAGEGVGGMADLRPYLASVQVQVIAVTPGSRAIGRSLRDLDLRRNTGASVLAMIRSGSVAGVPEPDQELAEGDSLVLIGSAEQVGAACEALS